MRALRFTLALLLATHCSRPAADGRRQKDASAPLAPRALASPVVLANSLRLPAPPLPPSPPLDRAWVELVRMERWQEAAVLLAQEPEAVRLEPRVRYVQASVAEQLGDAEGVLRLLEGLETELPVLAERIAARRGDAALKTGDAKTAFAYFASRTDAASQLKAAEAQAELGERAAARLTLEAVLRRVPKKADRCALEAPARRLLADLTPGDAPALLARDLRWLAVEAPLCESAEGAALRLERLPAPWPLTRSERQQRARTFAEAGLVERTEEELSALSRLAQTVEAGLASTLRGRARSNARRELAFAAELLLQAAVQNPAGAPALWFEAAKAHERAGAPDAALALYARVLRSQPSGPLAENAEYRRADLLYGARRFAEALKAYASYLARYGAHGRFADAARDERAVAWLVGGAPARAARAFAELAQGARELRIRARYEQLEAVALLRAGERARALEGWRKVVRDYPLSFAALAAAARLESLGETAPGLALPAALTQQNAVAGSDLQPEVPLPPLVALLHDLGLDREAEQTFVGVEASFARAAPKPPARALCSAYARLAPAERSYRLAQDAVSADELSKAPVAERRWLWDCVYPRPYAPLVDAQARKYNLEPELIYAIMRQESSFRPEVVSPARAIGLLQILSTTGERLAAELGIPFHPRLLREPPVNVALGAHYLRKLMDIFQGNCALAAAGYNAGPNAVLRWLEGSPSFELDLFVARIPYAETRAYVERVLGNQARYAYLRGGAEAVPRLTLALPTPSTEGVDLY